MLTKTTSYEKYEEAERIIKAKMAEYGIKRDEMHCPNCGRCDVNEKTKNRDKKYFCKNHKDYIDHALAENIPCISFLPKATPKEAVKNESQ